jgi:hypothetical protein
MVASNITIKNRIGLASRNSSQEEEGCSKEEVRALWTLLENDIDGLEFSCHHYHGRRKIPPACEGPVVWSPVPLECGGGGGLIALEGSVTATRMDRSLRGSSDESTGGETKGRLLIGVSNLTIKRKNWTG